MKYIILGMIKVYQMLPFRCHFNCKFTPSCSNYAIIAIKRFGALKGTIITIKRIIKCSPFTKCYGYDPVPEELKK